MRKVSVPLLMIAVGVMISFTIACSAAPEPLEAAMPGESIKSRPSSKVPIPETSPKPSASKTHQRPEPSFPTIPADWQAAHHPLSCRD